MGLFQQSKEEENTWAALPGEPRGTTDGVDTLAVASDADLLEVGLGAQYTSVVFPVAPAAPDAVVVENREPDQDADDPAAS